VRTAHQSGESLRRTLRGIKGKSNIATAKTARALLRAETIDFIASSFFLLPSSFFLLPSSFFLLPSSFFLLPSSFFLLPSSFFLLPSAIIP